MAEEHNRDARVAPQKLEASPAPPELIGALLDLARLAKQAGTVRTEQGVHNIASALLARLLSLCAAQRGAVMLVSAWPAAPTALPEAQGATRPLCLVAHQGMPEHEVFALVPLLPAMPSDLLTIQGGSEVSCWLLYHCSLEGAAPARLAQDHQAAMPEPGEPAVQAYLLLGWDGMQGEPCTAALATPLGLPEKSGQDQQHALQAVRRWLATHDNWLLILDNVEDMTLFSTLPSTGGGYVLLTTRSQITGPFAQCLDLEQMTPEEGALFLLRRARLLEPDVPLEKASQDDQDGAKEISRLLSGLPLALDQAGAYIEETGCSLSGYIERYQSQRATLLNRRGLLLVDHPESVSTTISLSFEKLEQTDQAAADLLRVFAFLDPDAIPEELLIEGASELGPTLEPLARDALAFDDALAVLRTCSLVRRNPEDQTCTMHRLVQAVLRERMDEETRRAWAERAVRVVNRAFPNVSALNIRPTWRRYLPHAQVCAEHIEHWGMNFPEASRLLHQTGAYLKEQARYAQAERFLCNAHALRRQALGPAHPSVAESLHELAELAEHQGKYPQAESLYQQALVIREQTLGPEHLDVAATLHGLAVFHFYHGPFARAEQLFKRALAIREKALGSERPLVAAILNDLALLYHDQGKDVQAERLYQRALTIFERTVGPNHSLVGTTTSNLAKLYNDQGRYLLAEPLHRRALLINEETLGPEHPHLAFNLHDLAIIKQRRGDYAQAEQLHRRALAINKQAVGADHSDVANSLNCLGQCYLEQGRYEEAEPLLTRALTIFEQTREPGYVYTGHCLRNLGRLYSAQARYQEAEPLFERALAIFEQTQGSEHPEVASLLEYYAVLFTATQRETEAARLRARAERIRMNYARQNQLPEEGAGSNRS